MLNIAQALFPWIFHPITVTLAVFASANCLAHTSGSVGSVGVGTTATLYSNILMEERTVLMYSPPAHTKKQKIHMPLILVLDAETLFELAVSTSRFMCYSSEVPQMPEAVIVGIPNTRRNRDMPVPRSYGSNDEKNFMQFIISELLPYLNKKYPLNGHTIIVGHSQGGLFASYLLVQQPSLFSWILSLDAPMNIDPKTDFIKKGISRIARDEAYAVKYVSIEQAFGWGKEWDRLMPNDGRILRLTYRDETHESVPGRGMYEGLKFLFRDYAPDKKDMTLTQLKEHYSSVSATYGHTYEIPLRVLLGSASRTIMDQRRKEALELTQYAESVYGLSNETSELTTNALSLSHSVSSLVDHYISLPVPSVQEISPFIGIWQGVQSRKQLPPENIEYQKRVESITLEISILSGSTAAFRIDPPWAQGKRIKQEVFTVTKDGELIYGYKNMGSGLILSKARLNSRGNLEGTTQLTGFTAPEDLPEQEKRIMEWIQKTPQTFELKKKRPE